MYDFARDSETANVDQLRARLKKMSDEELRAYGKAAAFMCTAAANLDKPPRPAFVIQLEEARAEWRRRSQHNSNKLKD